MKKKITFHPKMEGGKNKIKTYIFYIQKLVGFMHFDILITVSYVFSPLTDSCFFFSFFFLKIEDDCGLP